MNSVCPSKLMCSLSHLGQSIWLFQLNPSRDILSHPVNTVLVYRETNRVDLMLDRTTNRGPAGFEPPQRIGCQG